MENPSTPPTINVEGRRIISFQHFYSKLKEIAGHGVMSCGLSAVDVVSEKRKGFISEFTLKCRMCNEKFSLENDAQEEINLNVSAVAGTIAIGSGQSQLQELSAALNLPIITPIMYQKYHEKVSSHWLKSSYESMEKAAAKERDLAIAEGRVDKNGTPIIDVIVDGCWSKRTYKKNYSALSGAAAIIGKLTGQVLFLGVKNKYCCICARAEKTKQQPKDHVCYKNYHGPSTGMESEILVEGFKCSVEMHGLIYGKMVSDGDSSTYAKLLKSRPYPHVTIEKIECRNHLLRNFCNKLNALNADTKYPLIMRKMITQKKIMVLRKTIRCIIKHYKADTESERRCNIELLYNDLLLAHLHAFDDHSRCKAYFCDTARATELEGQSSKNGFFTSTLWSKICQFMSNLASHATSLIHDVDSNTVERYNSIVAKFVGGKRINFSKKGSYQMRCHAAVVSFNTHNSISTLYKSVSGRSPRGSVKKFEEKRLKALQASKKVLRKRNRMLFSKGEDINYGEQCEKPDMQPDIYEKEKTTFLQNLSKTKAERERIERATVLQSSCSEWMELRRKILTASNFGKVVRRRNDISCSNLVKDILYKDSIAHVSSIKHGRDNEEKALRQLEIQEKVTIRKCGLFIDDEIPYLGATPDGLVGEDTIVEIKCPLNVYNKSAIDAVKDKKLTFLKDVNGELVVNKKHIWFYQIQGQLHITKKEKCLFAIWCGEDRPLITRTIEKDNDMWKHEMENKLCNFYLTCMLPELVDPRYPRNLKIRDPPTIQEAIKKKQEKLSAAKKRKIEENKENLVEGPATKKRKSIRKGENKKTSDLKESFAEDEINSKRKRKEAIDNALKDNIDNC